MELYKNLNGNSGVSSYELNSDAILVKFSGNIKIYTYDYISAGRENVEHMKLLATNGRGLNSFIRSNVRLLYVR